jgi:lipopolysaccharide export system permease protein
MSLYVPTTLNYALPIAVLFAAAFTLSDLYAKNELVVIFASGVSLLRFTLPLLVFSFVLTFGMFFFQDTVAVPTYAAKQKLQRTLLNEEQSLNNNSIVVLSDNGRIVYTAQFYNDENKRLFNMYVVLRDKQKKLSAVIRADSAVWDESARHWSLSNGIQYTAADNGFSTEPVSVQLVKMLTERPETFRNNTINVDEVSTAEAKTYIEHLEKAGLPAAEAKSEYYKKYSFPFIVFIVVFLSIGLSGRSRKNVLLLSLALSIGAAVLFYVAQMVTMLMAKFGYLQPAAGAWLPVILFIIVSSIVVRYART